MVNTQEQNQVDSQLSLGLHTDREPHFQPRGTYRFALNAVLETESGDDAALSSEQSNAVCQYFSEGYSVVGTHLKPDDSVIVFLTNNSRTIIGELDSRCVFTELIVTDCLGLSTRNKRIDCIGRVIKGCEYMIYFTDETNDYYSINLNNLSAYTNDGYTPTTANADPSVGWNCKLFKFFLDYTTPTFDSMEVQDSGGTNKVGTKSFAIRYVADSGAVTPWMEFSKYIAVVDEPDSTLQYRIDGAYNTGSAVSGGVPATNKSILITLGNLDITYDYYQLAVIEVISGLQVVSDVYILTKQPITSDTQEFVYTGYDNQIDSQTTIAEIKVPTVRLSKVGSHEMTQERLILANTEEKFYDYSTFQQYASLIVVGFTNSLSSTSINPLESANNNAITSGKSAIYYLDKTFIHDEVEAVGIVYKMENGDESPVFHIPGRPKDVGVVLDPVALTIDYKSSTQLVADQTNLDYSSRNEVPTGENWDTQLLTVVSHFDWTTGSSDPQKTINERDVAHLGLIVGNTVERYKVHNTAAYYSANRGGVLAYYDCGENNTYPAIPLECSSGSDYWGYDAWENPLAGMPIRHHRLPDTSINLQSIDLKESYSLQMVFSNIQMPPGAIGYKIVVGEHNEQNRTVHQKGISYLANHYADEFAEDTYISDNMFGYNQHNYHLSNPASGQRSCYPYAFTSDKYSDSNNDLYSIPSGLNIKGSKYLVFKSADSDFLKSTLKGNYLKFESIISNDVIAYGEDTAGPDQNRFSGSALIKASIRGELFNEKILNVCNRTLSEFFYLDPDTFTTDNSSKRISNMGLYNDALYIVTDTDVPDIVTTDDNTTNNYNYVNDDDPSNITTPTELYTHCYYVAVKSTAPIFTNLFAIEYLSTGNFVSQYQPFYTSTGNGFVNSYFSKRIAYNESCAVGTESNGARSWYIDGFDDVVNNASYRALLNVISESTLNVNLRHHYRSDLLSYYYPRNYAISNKGFLAYLFFDELDTVTPVSENAIDLDYMLGGASCSAPYGSHFAKKHREQFIYNVDYSKHNNDYKYFPLPSNYKFCENCSSKQTNRVWYSEKSFSEDNLDNFRTIKVNNYKDYFLEEGQITNLFLSHDNLYCQFENTTALIPTLNNELKTDNATNIYVGTGAFLSQPAKRLVTTKYAYGGLNDKFSCVVSEFGAIYVDDKTGKIFSISEQEGLDEISARGMRNWFEENIPLKFMTQFLESSSGILYPYRTNTLHPQGIGFHAVYDTRNKRYILHKKDFVSINRLWTKDANNTSAPEGVAVNDLVYNFYNGGFELVVSADPPQTGASIEYGDPDYFEDCSWTMSYDLRKKIWVSYHSYKPNLFYNTSETFYSVLNYGSSVSYKHNVPHDYLNFYGTQSPHVIDIINNQASNTEKYYDSIEYIGKVQKWNPIHKDYIDMREYTFNKVLFYNRNQISLEHELVPKFYEYQSIYSELYGGLISVARVEDYWRINHIRDYAVGRNNYDEPLFSSSWVNTANKYISKFLGYIDRVGNPASFSVDKPVYQIGRFKDKWLGIRLMYMNSDEDTFKITTNVVSFKIKPSNR